MLIGPGRFEMGSPDTDDLAYKDEKPQHKVRISRPFYLGAFEVTQGQFQAVLGVKNPSHFKLGDSHPVESVTWLDAIAYCNTLSRLRRTTTLLRCFRRSHPGWQRVSPAHGGRVGVRRPGPGASRARLIRG